VADFHMQHLSGLIIENGFCVLAKIFMLSVIKLAS